MRLALDHHFSRLIAVRLRELGHDVTAVVEKGWEAEADDVLLELCAAEGLTLVTNNVADFVRLTRQWGAEGRSHAGLVFTSDESLPRSRDAIGRHVERLEGLLRSNPGDDRFEDRVHWLGGGP